VAIFNPADAVRVGAFVNAAYSMDNNGRAGLTPDQIGLPGYTIHAYIVMRDFLPWKTMPEFYGIVATKDGADESVVAVRGTIGGTEWFDNIHPGIVPFKLAPGGVEAGFNKIYQTIQVVPKGWSSSAPSPAGTFPAQVVAAIAAHTSQSAVDVAQNHQVTVTGHSLGAALAILFVMDSAANHVVATPLVYTFAAPRVGDATFVTTYDALPGMISWRIFNKNDLVPNLPPDVWGFCHVAAPYEIDDTGKVKDTTPCHHSLSTYLHLLAPASPLDPGCTP
jgi:hypothetical protein